MVQNKQLAAVATLAAIGVANGFFAGPVLLRSSGLATRVAAVRMAATNDPSANIRRAGADVKKAGAAAAHKVEQKVDEVEAKAGTSQRVGTSVESREVIREAPIIKERIHEHTTEVDKTRIEEERIRTEVVQRVQPIKDERRVKEDVKKVDHG
jgi:ribosomal protein L9